jgi:hypothetical protein
LIHPVGLLVSSALPWGDNQYHVQADVGKKEESTFLTTHVSQVLLDLGS